MSSPVDVLAVMDAAIARNIERGAAKSSPSDKSMREARAIVAELIEATERMVQLYGGIGAATSAARAAVRRARGEA